VLTFSAGFTMSTLAVVRPLPAPAFWLLAGWALCLNGARNMALVLVHQCGHYRFTGNARVDRFVGECLSTFLCSQDVVSYRFDHYQLHHGVKSFTTDKDPVVNFIRRFGFRPGLSRRALWANTLKTMFSPYFHASYLYSRLKYNLFLTRGARRVAAWVYLGAWLSLVLLVEGMWKVWLVAFAVPVFFLYHQSAFLELLTEHAWFIARTPGETPREFIARRCWGRFCASPLPDEGIPAGARMIAWTQWAVAILFYHLPVRFLVLAGDAPQHDFHHRHPGTMDWPQAAYARQSDVDAGHSGWPEYWDVWGLHVAMDHVFDALGSLPATSIDEPRSANLAGAPSLHDAEQ
jgi:fatty acid desaturase